MKRVNKASEWNHIQCFCCVILKVAAQGGVNCLLASRTNEAIGAHRSANEKTGSQQEVSSLVSSSGPRDHNR